MSFDEEDRIVDPVACKVMLSWVYKIDIQGVRFVSLQTWLRITLAKMKFGHRARWRGLDLLYFDAEGLITKKLTHAKYAALRIVKGWVERT